MYSKNLKIASATSPPLICEQALWARLLTPYIGAEDLAKRADFISSEFRQKTGMYLSVEAQNFVCGFQRPGRP